MDPRESELREAPATFEFQGGLSDEDRGMLDAMAQRTAQLDLTIQADTAALGGLRLQVAVDAADSGCDLDVIEELVLVASELASNVIRHTEQSEVTVRLNRTEAAWELDVSGAEALDEVPGAAGMPEPIQAGGRGLVIVRAVMDDVQLIDDGDGRRWIRAVKQR